MSYDLEIVYPKQGADVARVVSDVLQRDVDERDTGLIEVIGEPTRRAIVSALLAGNVDFQVHPTSYTVLSGSSNSEVDQNVECVTLTDLKSLVQISISQEGFGIALPFGHESDAALSAFKEIQVYIETIETIIPCLTYDRQTGRIVDLHSEFSEGLSIYNWIRDIFHTKAG